MFLTDGDRMKGRMYIVPCFVKLPNKWEFPFPSRPEHDKDTRPLVPVCKMCARIEPLEVMSAKQGINSLLPLY